MSLYSCSVKMIQRIKGDSAVAAAAYRSRSKIKDKRTGVSYNFKYRKDDLVYQDIIAPNDVPNWVLYRYYLWNSIEFLEKRRDSQVAREVLVALPIELDKEAQIELVRNYILENFVSEGMVADFAIHRYQKKNEKDTKHENPHAHILLTTRPIVDGEFGKKNRDWNKTDALQQWRKSWEILANSALEKAGSDSRISSSSYKARGIDKLPQIHLGKKAYWSQLRSQQPKIYNLKKAGTPKAARTISRGVQDRLERYNSILEFNRQQELEKEQQRLAEVEQQQIKQQEIKQQQIEEKSQPESKSLEQSALDSLTEEDRQLLQQYLLPSTDKKKAADSQKITSQDFVEMIMPLVVSLINKSQKLKLKSTVKYKNTVYQASYNPQTKCLSLYQKEKPEKLVLSAIWNGEKYISDTPDKIVKTPDNFVKHLKRRISKLDELIKSNSPQDERENYQEKLIRLIIDNYSIKLSDRLKKKNILVQTLYGNDVIIKKIVKFRHTLIFKASLRGNVWNIDPKTSIDDKYAKELFDLIEKAIADIKKTTSSQALVQEPKKQTGETR